jgi:ParB family chromosome partitioning protein
MKRKDMLKSAFGPDPAPTPPTTTPATDRVPSGAVRAMGLSLGRIGEDAARVATLEQQLARGEMVQDLDPAIVEPSFVEDRLARTADPDFRRLVESIGATGQQVPILVRPHPARPGAYQVAYGHRRLNACTELGRKVKAIIRTLTDAELVVAQGKENAERRNLSFIERAMFAAHLERQGFERATIQSALSVHPAELTRFLAVSRSIPTDIIQAIGPSPRAGRPRWMELAKLLEAPAQRESMTRLTTQPSFRGAGTDARFDQAIETLRAAPVKTDAAPALIRDRDGQPVIRAERSPHTLRLVVDLKAAPGLDAHLLALLPGIVAGFGAE